MEWKTLTYACSGLNVLGARLAMKRLELYRVYMSRSIRHYEELLGIGLPARNPIQFIQENGWAEAQAADTVQFPVNLGQDAGAQP
ncbi:MAG: hypothetical protein ACRD7E_07665, partial [Bryobacteraceae bacterium]